MKPTVLFIFGTRPEIIKLWPVITEARRAFGSRHVRLLLTGQHREMADSFLKLFSIRPHHNLHIMRPNQTLESVARQTLQGVTEVLQSQKIDWVVVQGDTTSAFAGALAAFYQRVKVAHVEAGLRTFNLDSPYPEELNRQLISRAATLNFCPTRLDRKNLLGEGISTDRIRVTGNTIVDALLRVKKEFLRKTDVTHMFPQIDFSKKLVLVTGHRRESFGEGFRNICLALRELSTTRDDAVFVYPVHLNPNVRQSVTEILGWHRMKSQRLLLMEPVGYLELVYLLSRSALVLTDSGGIQEEAPTFGVPVLVMRDHTERMESIRLGLARLVGTSRKKIVSSVKELLDRPRTKRTAKNPYGDGKASQRIIQAIENF